MLTANRQILPEGSRLPVALAALLQAAVLCLASSAAPAQPSFWQAEWPNTDFTNTTVDFADIISGGPPKDGIPALSDPEFLPVADETRLAGQEPVMTLEIEGEIPRAYPIRYLLWHEIVNDKIGMTPVAVTYCPLCNSAIVFDRRVGSEVLTFGVSGKLRHSDMIMYDRETESWWQQAVGEGIVGSFAGVELDTLPAWMESWSQFVSRNPDGWVMDQPRYRRMYGVNPYQRYDTSSRPFLYYGEDPPFGIHPLSRVVRVGNKAWLLERLREAEKLSEQGLEFSWTAGQSSPLDSQQIAEGRDIGSIRVRDAASGKDVSHDVMFAFAFHAFYPEGEWVLAN